MSLLIRIGHFGRVACVRLMLVMGILGAALSQTATAYEHYDQVDYVTALDFSRFQAIWDKAQTQTVRLGLLGDSQETSPGGSGNRYIPHLNNEFFNHYGKVGESFLVGPGSYGAPAEWLLRGATPTAGMGNGLTDSERLPGHTTQRYPSNHPYGALIKLEWDNHWIQSPSLKDVPVWDSSKPLHATLFARQRAGSAPGLKWETRPSDRTTPYFYDSVSASGTVDMGLDNGAGQFVSYDIGPLPYNGKKYQQLLVKGSSTAGADYVGVRFYSPESLGGVVVQDFAAGGYHTGTILTNHADSGPMLKAFGPWDAIVVHTGANDAAAGYGKSAQEHRLEMQNLIDTVRGPNWLNNPTQKFILVTDPYRVMTQPEFEDKHVQFDQYAGVLAAIAEADPNIMAINSRRLTSDQGWNRQNGNIYELFLDGSGVHYKEGGAQMLAEADAQLMLFGPGIFNGDFDNDGDKDGADFLKWQRGETVESLSPDGLAAWQENFGTEAGSMNGASIGVPEPVSAVLLVLGGATTIVFAKRLGI